MSALFCDTSGFYALTTSLDPQHDTAERVWHAALSTGQSFVTTNYVFTETVALVQGRHGMSAAARFMRAIDGIVEISFLDSVLHAEALRKLFSINRRAVSFVDCTSFEFMRARHIDRVFGFDSHFEEHGFTLARA